MTEDLRPEVMDFDSLEVSTTTGTATVGELLEVASSTGGTVTVGEIYEASGIDELLEDAARRILTAWQHLETGNATEAEVSPELSGETSTETSTVVRIWWLLPPAPTPLRLALGREARRFDLPPRSRPPSLLYACSHRSHAPPTARPRAEEVVAAR